MSLLYRRQTVFAILIFTIIIDVMGFGLVIPMLSNLFFGAHPALSNPAYSAMWRHIDYGISLAAWPIGIFFGAAYLGKLSDSYGRKPLMILCLLGEAVSYVLAVLSLYWRSVPLFVISRALAGYFSGSFDLAQAAVVDISTDADRLRNMGWITFAGTTGFIFGPLVSGLTAHISLTTPLWIAVFLSLANALILWLVFRERFTLKHHIQVPFSVVFTACILVFRDRRVRRLAWVFLFSQIAWALYVLTLPVMAHQLLGWNTRGQSILFMTSGIASVLNLLLLQPRLFKRFSHKSMVMGSVIVWILLMLGLILYPVVWNQYVVIAALSVGMLVIYTAMLSFLSHAVTTDEQGAVLGGIASCFAIAQMVGAVCLSFLLNISVFLPLWISLVFIILCALTLRSYRHDILS